MLSSKSLLLSFALASISLAAPTPQYTTSPSPSTLSAADLIAMDPVTASCPSTGDYADQCADATRAAPAISASFTKYNITTPGARAALIAIMLFESVSFRYNHFLGTGSPGQGTRNMQMARFNELYATQLFGAQAVADAKTSGTQDAVEDRVLALVQGDAESFASAAWFVTTQCQADVLDGLADGSSAGWDAYLTACIGTTHTAERDVSWTAAKKVLGV